MALLQARLAALRVKLAYPEVFEAMGIADLRVRLRDVPGIEGLTMRYAPNGREIYMIGDSATEVKPGASTEEIRQALLNPFVSKETKMSVTGATFLGEDFKAKIAAAKDKITKAHGSVDASLGNLNIAGDKMTQIAADIQKEADDLNAAIGQVSNMPSSGT